MKSHGRGHKRSDDDMGDKHDRFHRGDTGSGGGGSTGKFNPISDAFCSGWGRSRGTFGVTTGQIPLHISVAFAFFFCVGGFYFFSLSR